MNGVRVILQRVADGIYHKEQTVKEDIDQALSQLKTLILAEKKKIDKPSQNVMEDIRYGYDDTYAWNDAIDRVAKKFE